MEIRLNVTIHRSGRRQTFMVMSDDSIYDEVIGLDTGLHYAISDYIGSFNAMGYTGPDGTPLRIDNEDVRLSERKEWKIVSI